MTVDFVIIGYKIVRVPLCIWIVVVTRAEFSFVVGFLEEALVEMLAHAGMNWLSNDQALLCQDMCQLILSIVFVLLFSSIGSG